MSESKKTFVLTFKDESSYERYKQEVTAKGGIILNDFGRVIRGFTVSIPLAIAEAIQSRNFADQGISTFEPDSTVSIQKQ